MQGVGFRWWVRCRARELGLDGWAENLHDGRVRVVAEGPRFACSALLRVLRGPDSPGQAAGVDAEWSTAEGGLDRFVER